MSEASTARAPGVAARIDEARSLADNGKILEAEQAFLEVLREAPARDGRAQFRRDLRARARALRAGARAARARARHSRGRSGDVDQSWRDVRRARPARPGDRGAAHGAEARARSLRRPAASCRSARARRSRQRCAAALFWRDFRGARRGAMARRRDHARRAFGRWCCMRCARSRRDVVSCSRICLSPLRRASRCGGAGACRKMPRRVSDRTCRPTIPIRSSARNSSTFPICRRRNTTKRNCFRGMRRSKRRCRRSATRCSAVLAADNGFEPFLGHFDSDKLEGHLANAIGPPVWNAFFFFRHGTRYEATIIDVVRVLRPRSGTCRSATCAIIRPRCATRC